MNFKKYFDEIKRNKFDKWILSNYKEVMCLMRCIFSYPKKKKDDFNELATRIRHSSFSPCEIMKNYLKNISNTYLYLRIFCYISNRVDNKVFSSSWHSPRYVPFSNSFYSLRLWSLSLMSLSWIQSWGLS